MKKIGILGGGQLGKMLLQEGINYPLEFHVLDPDPACSCAGIAQSFTCGDFKDEETVYAFGKELDLITIEIENVSIDGLKRLVQSGVEVYPQPEVIELIKDKGLQKQFYRDHQIPSSEFRLIENQSDLASNLDFLPVMQKLRVGGYDGKGVQPIHRVEDISKGFDAPSVLEKFVDLEAEAAVLVARSSNGEVKSFPVTGLVFNPVANLVEMLVSPASFSDEIKRQCEELAIKVASSLQIVGLLAVELFITKSGEVLLNEIAPRPHNSGHQTIEGNITSQYMQHLRAILGWPLGNTSSRGYSAMINLLGKEGHQGEPVIENLSTILQTPGAYLHWYGKTTTKPFRKMGHITVTGSSAEEVEKNAKHLLSKVFVISKKE